MVLQETYELEDCIIYDTSNYEYGSGSQIWSKSITMPSSFRISFDVTRNSSNAGYGYITIGSNINNGAVFGMLGGNGTNGIWKKQGGSYVIQKNNPTPITDTSKHNYVYEYNNGEHTYIVDGNTIFSFTDSTIPLTTFLQINGSLSLCTNILIKPL